MTGRIPVLALLSTAVALLAVASPAVAGKPSCAKSCPDTTLPSVAISSPAPGTTLSGTVGVVGSSSDNKAVSAVAVSVDGGAWQAAVGTVSWSWSWDTASSATGSHVLTARATDTSGNARTTSVSVNVRNDLAAPTVTITAPASGATLTGTVSVAGSAGDDVAVAAVSVSVDGAAWQPASGTTSWSWPWTTTGVADGSHTISARATDASGKVTTSSRTVTVANQPTSPPPSPPAPPQGTPAPQTQGSWVSPEGVTINIASAGSWTIAQIYSMLTANALDLDKVGPHLTIEVQDQYSSQTSASAVLYHGQYSGYTATMYLEGVNSAFAERPDDILTHEYGHAWSRYWYYLAHQGSWATYSGARWTTTNGSLTLATDSRTGTSYTWQIGEIIADDYRLLFGSTAAVAERPTHLNTQIPDARDVGGLRDFLLTSWRSP